MKLSVSGEVSGESLQKCVWTILQRNFHGKIVLLTSANSEREVAEGF